MSESASRLGASQRRLVVASEDVLHFLRPVASLALVQESPDSVAPLSRIVTAEGAGGGNAHVGADARVYGGECNSPRTKS